MKKYGANLTAVPHKAFGRWGWNVELMGKNM